MEGIGAILTGPSGEVYAHAFDFDRSGYGGFKLWEAQKMRAKRFCVDGYIKNYVGGDAAAVLDDHDAGRIVDRLCRDKKYRMTFVAVGYGPEIDLT